MKKKLIRIMSFVLLIVSLLMAAGLSSFATVSPKTIKASPGETKVIEFQYGSEDQKIMGYQGRLIFSNPEKFSSKAVDFKGGLQGFYGEADGEVTAFGLQATASFTVKVTVTISENAKPGDTYTVSLKGYSSIDGAEDLEEDEWTTETVTIVIVEKLETATLRGLIAQAEGIKSSAYTANTWKTLQNALAKAKNALNSATTQREIDSAADSLRDAIKGLEKLPAPPTIDYTDLLKQIKVAEGLVEQDYTAESWKVMKDALAVAKSAKNSTDQSTVDFAAKALRDAINALVPLSGSKVVNYDELNKQIAVAEALKQSDYTAASWTAFAKALANAKEARSFNSQTLVNLATDDLKEAMKSLVKLNTQRLSDALESLKAYAENSNLVRLISQINDLLAKGEAALQSGDQALIDSCAEELEALLSAILKELEDLKVGTVIVEKPVATDPTDGICNIGSHVVWIVLFWISFSLNIAAAAFIFTYYFMKKKKTLDDTPLVDYDITDDVE